MDVIPNFSSRNSVNRNNNTNRTKENTELPLGAYETTKAHFCELVIPTITIISHFFEMCNRKFVSERKKT